MTSTGENGQPKSSGFHFVFSREEFMRNGSLAVIVGCLLTITNQLDVLLTQRFTFRLGTKILFNFLIPFVVSCTSALMNRK